MKMRFHQISSQSCYCASGLKSRQATFVRPFVNPRGADTCTPFLSLMRTNPVASAQ